MTENRFICIMAMHDVIISIQTWFGHEGLVEETSPWVFPKNLFSENHWTNLSQQTYHSKVDSLKRNAIQFLTTFMTQNYLFWSKRFSNMVFYNFVACCFEYRKYIGL